ncbi:thioredoxin domain-containing protein [Microbacterium sp. GXF7504]
MNDALATSASPYLRAHADNPVAWRPWGREAFEEARRRDVPVMVSIGYSTCHWCHVMARESFQDAATAAQLNEGFVAVKVDREEHPDVDRAFLSAASAFTRNLGWPLTVFTDADGAAFFAGTYWPPMPRGGSPAFRDVLRAVTEAWTERRGEVAATAAALRDALAEAARAGAGPLPDAAAVVAAARTLAGFEDPEYGGFAAPGAPVQTPKFPTVPALRLLRAPLVVADAPDAAAVADRALRAMAASPLRDRDGGFFRYATRRDWSVPHYERMLTDNAGLLALAVELGDLEVARGVVSFLAEVMERPGGGLAAAQDSESWIDGERSEGGYYARDDEERARLERPSVDGKVVTGWNGLAVAALARYAAVTGDESALGIARRAVDAVLGANVGPDGVLRRASLDEVTSRAVATAADHGALAEGLVALACATGEVAYAERARELVDRAGTATGDPALDALGVPPGEDSDGDHPGGPASVAAAALRLWWMGAGDAYRERAEALVAAHAARALADPAAHGAILRVAAELAVPPRQVVVVAEAGETAMRAAAREVDADLVAVVSSLQARAFSAAGFTLFDGRDVQDGRATAYDCRGFVCRLPVVDPGALASAR